MLSYAFHSFVWLSLHFLTAAQQLPMVRTRHTSILTKIWQWVTLQKHDAKTDRHRNMSGFYQFVELASYIHILIPEYGVTMFVMQTLYHFIESSYPRLRTTSQMEQGIKIIAFWSSVIFYVLLKKYLPTRETHIYEKWQYVYDLERG